MNSPSIKVVSLKGKGHRESICLYYSYCHLLYSIVSYCRSCELIEKTKAGLWFLWFVMEELLILKQYSHSRQYLPCFSITVAWRTAGEKISKMPNITSSSSPKSYLKYLFLPVATSFWFASKEKLGQIHYDSDLTSVRTTIALKHVNSQYHMISCS